MYLYIYCPDFFPTIYSEELKAGTQTGALYTEAHNALVTIRCIFHKWWKWLQCQGLDEQIKHTTYVNNGFIELKEWK